MNKSIEEAVKDLKAGSVITCMRPEYSNSVHRYTLIKDESKYKLLSDGYKIMSSFESLHPSDAISYLEGGGLRMKIVEIKSPSKTDFYYAEKANN